MYYVYFLTNSKNKVIYVGITNNLHRRIYEHKMQLINGFSKKYNLDKLVYFETFNEPRLAITREKQIKAGSINKKIILIETLNPEWIDLYESI